MTIKGIVFDKDGTLIDFRDTWDAWAGALIDEAVGSDSEAANRLAAAMVYDLASRTFDPASPIIAGTAFEAAECVARGLGRRDVEAVEAWMAERAAEAAMIPVCDLQGLCQRLKAAGLVLGVATNDAEAVARANLQTLRLTEAFDYVAGFDSGHGGKPGPGMVSAFCSQTGLAPETVVMVGDSTHDLIAGKAAGTRTAGVLTGTAGAQTLEPFADVILPDISHIPDWLGL